MYYILLFVGVLSFLAIVAWVDPTHRRMLARSADIARRGGAGRSAQKGAIGPLRAAEALQPERKLDMPCLTPIDCVRDRRCAGHCGCR